MTKLFHVFVVLFLTVSLVVSLRWRSLGTQPSEAPIIELSLKIAQCCQFSLTVSGSKLAIISSIGRYGEQ